MRTSAFLPDFHRFFLSFLYSREYGRDEFLEILYGNGGNVKKGQRAAPLLSHCYALKYSVCSVVRLKQSFLVSP